MARKNLMRLQARVNARAVTLSFYKGTPLFRREKGPCTVRVMVKPEPDFEFGGDYEEYFHDLDWRDAEVVFEGRLEVANERKFTVELPPREVGFTGAYWVQLEGDDHAVGPVAVRVRDPYVWWPEKQLNRELDALGDAAPDTVRLMTVGSTVRGRDVRAVFAGTTGPCVAFVGLVHPGESGPELIIPALRRLVTERPDLLHRARVAVLPSLGLDGREDQVAGVPWYIRTNANGVDLNRNFAADWEEPAYGYGLDSSDPDAATYRGRAPESEPETNAAVAFLDQAKPQAVFSFHCLASICSNAFLTSADAAADDAYVSRATRIATWYQQGMFPENSDEAMLHFACSTGSLPHWLYSKRRIPAFDLELGQDQEATACVMDNTSRKLLDTYRERHYRGLVNVLEHLVDEPKHP